MAEKITVFSEEGKKAIRKIIREELGRRIVNLEVTQEIIVNLLVKKGLIKIGKAKKKRRGK